MSTNTPTEPKLAYTYAEAGRALGISPRSVWSLVARGQVRPCRIGRSVRISADELRRFIAHQEGANNAS